MSMSNARPPVLTINETVDRAVLHQVARQLHPRGLAGIPAQIALKLGLPEVPPILAAMFGAIAAPEPLTLTLRNSVVNVSVVLR